MTKTKRTKSWPQAHENGNLIRTGGIDREHDIHRNGRHDRHDPCSAPLLLQSNWILTSEDIDGAVQAIEVREGWLWLEDGYYLDEDPRLKPDEIN